MAILNIQLGQAGLVGVRPRLVYLLTDDTVSEVLTTGYLNSAVEQGFYFEETDMACVATKASSSAAYTVGWFEVSKSGSNWSLVATAAPGSVVLPTVANRIVHAIDTNGTVSTDAANVVNAGSITASTGNITATTGALVAGTTVTGGTGVTATTGNVSAIAGNVIAGASGAAGTLISFPSTAANGSLIISALNAGGAFNTTIRNSVMGQSTVYSIPDVGAATGQFGVVTGAMVSGNFPIFSGTAGKMADSGAKLYAGTTGAYAGGGTSNAFTVTGLSASAKGSAVIRASTNAVSIVKAVPGTNTLTVDFSADPGAGTTVDYIYSSATLS